MAPLITERTIHCRSDPAALWEVLADTERMNRAIGMDRVSFSPAPASGSVGAARYIGTTRLGGFQVSYEERPFEWVAGKNFRVERRMRSGPAERVVMAYSVAPAGGNGGGSVVSVHLTVTMRVGLASPFARISSAQALSRIAAVIRRADEALAAGAALPALAPGHAVHDDALRRALVALSDDPFPDLVARLATFLRTGPDVDIARMRPFVLADTWGVHRVELLSVMLRAVRAGLLDLSWDLVCPSCRVASGTVPTLGALKDHGTCQLCEIDFGLDVDEMVEATFSPAVGVREVDRGPYCVGGPGRSPHVVVQAILPAHGEGTLTAPVEPGRYRLFVRGGAVVPLEVSEGAPETVVAAPGKEAGAVITVRPGGTVVVPNDGDERHAKIERSAWAQQGATARVVTALADFRRDFSSDVLRPGTALKVSRVALFFSDLTGSTQLYSTVGDAAAFRLVHDHFDVVTREVERHRGALVKTIGDAVMAVFSSDLDAVAAAVEVLRAFEGFRAEHPHRALTHIKLGVFAGSCYVVTANHVLDYFGQAVNIAARLQGQAASGELVLDEGLATRAITHGILGPGYVRERFTARLKGVDDGVRAVRVALPTVESQPGSG